jgi:hypothetical protein
MDWIVRMGFNTHIGLKILNLVWVRTTTGNIPP